MEINFEGAQLLSQAAAQAQAAALNDGLDEVARNLRRWEAVENPDVSGSYAVVLMASAPK